jgi:hypothetical protein
MKEGSITNAVPTAIVLNRRMGVGFNIFAAGSCGLPLELFPSVPNNSCVEYLQTTFSFHTTALTQPAQWRFHSSGQKNEFTTQREIKSR